MSKKLLLVSANQLSDPYPVYPVGIAYLSDFLKRQHLNLEIRVFDMNLEGIDRLEDLLKSFSPDFVGVSLRNIDGANSFNQVSFVEGYGRLVALIRSATPATLILGGAGFSIYAEKLFDLLQPDFGVWGEGEKTFSELLFCLENNLDYSTIEGLLYLKDGRIIRNERKNGTCDFNAGFDDRLIDYYWEKSGMLNIQTKRGCNYKCIYCSYPLIEGRKVRSLPAEQIVENLAKLSADKGINYVFFTDSIFNIETEKNIRLAELIIQRNLKIRWAAYFSPSNLTDEELALYKRSGLTHIEFGTESFSDTQLKNYGKSFTFETALKTSELALKYNIFYAHFLILGGYGETDQTLAETFENSLKLRYTVMFPFVGMRIYPGTKLQEYAIRDGVIDETDDLLEPRYYISPYFDQAGLKEKAYSTGKAWIFPGDVPEEMIREFRFRKKKKGLIWEYLRKP